MHSTTLDMTKGSPWKLIAGFALPVLLSQIFQQLYNTADTLIVGRYLGDEALAAVSSSAVMRNSRSRRSRSASVISSFLSAEAASR